MDDTLRDRFCLLSVLWICFQFPDSWKFFFLETLIEWKIPMGLYDSFFLMSLLSKFYTNSIFFDNFSSLISGPVTAAVSAISILTSLWAEYLKGFFRRPSLFCFCCMWVRRLVFLWHRTLFCSSSYLESSQQFYMNCWNKSFVDFHHIELILVFRLYSFVISPASIKSLADCNFMHLHFFFSILISGKLTAIVLFYVFIFLFFYSHFSCNFTQNFRDVLIDFLMSRVSFFVAQGCIFVFIGVFEF